MVAKRIPDGYISAHANQVRITTIDFNDLNLPVQPRWISHAREWGFFRKDKEFSFSDIYNPVDFGGARFCDARVWLSLISTTTRATPDYAMGTTFQQNASACETKSKIVR